MIICTSDNNCASAEILLYRNVLGEAMDAATKIIKIGLPREPDEDKLTCMDHLKIIQNKNERSVREYYARLDLQAKDQRYFRRNNKDFIQICDLADYDPEYILGIYEKFYEKKCTSLPQEAVLMLQKYKEVRYKITKLIETQWGRNAKKTTSQ